MCLYPRVLKASRIHNIFHQELYNILPRLLNWRNGCDSFDNEAVLMCWGTQVNQWLYIQSTLIVSASICNDKFNIFLPIPLLKVHAGSVIFHGVNKCAHHVVELSAFIYSFPKLLEVTANIKTFHCKWALKVHVELQNRNPISHQNLFLQFISPCIPAQAKYISMPEPSSNNALYSCLAEL